MSDQSPAKRHLTPDDLFAIRLVGDVQASPDGSRIAWTVVTLDKEQDAYRSTIWIADADGANARQLTAGTVRDTSPTWSPDGTRLAFVSPRPYARTPNKASDEATDAPKKPGKDVKKTDTPTPKPLPQIWTIAIDGGEATQATAHPNGASSPSWSPDGTCIAFVAQDEVPDDAGFLAPTSVGPVADERVVNDLRYRFDARGWLEKYSHIWTVDLTTDEMTQLTNGDVNDSEPAWSPRGDAIAFAGNRRDDRKRLGAQTILTISPHGGEPAAVAPDDAHFGSPAWSPDGSLIAFAGHLDARGGGALNNRLWTVKPDGSSLLNRTQTWDVSLGDAGMSDVVGDGSTDLRWRGDNEILFLGSTHGQTRVWAYTLDADEPVAITASGQRRVSSFAITQGGLAFASGAIHLPFELHTADADGANEQTITTVNAEFLAAVDLPEGVDITATAPDGTSIQGWLIPPAGFDPANPGAHPLIVQIHGGPHAMYGYAMFHEMQLMAAKGYAVLFSNPRGSSGYGEEFTGITRGRWGESDMPDVIAVLEQAIADHPWIDTDNLGITGGSYGGYLTNWIVGHDTRFKAAVTQRCVSNFYSFFGTSDIGFDFSLFEFDGTPWADGEKLLKYSPISYVDKIETPLLIVHNELDFRCPIEQAEQMFTALKFMGKDVAFVRIPGESHGLSRNGTPSRRLARLHHMIGWFDDHLDHVKAAE
ncbi:MAG: S9 family peptidase [Thermomicrobiales bacterium]